MTYQYPIQSTGVPSTSSRDPRPHRCGKCANPFTAGGNPQCPNNPNPPVMVESPVDAELARLIAEMRS